MARMASATLCSPPSGLIVMLRSLSLKAGGDGGSAGGLSWKRLCRSGVEKESLGLFEVVDSLGLVGDDAFRNIVGFL